MIGAKLYRVKIRKDLAEVKPNARLLDGRCFWFRPGWDITLEDSVLYAGETAMTWADPLNIPLGAPCWIASGDLVEVSAEERRKALFESWAASQGLLLRRVVSDERYESMETEWAWRGCKALAEGAIA